MIRSNFEMPRVPDDYFEPAPKGTSRQDASPPVQIASTLDYDGASRRLTLTKSDGTVQEFPANNNVQRVSRGKWENGTFGYSHHTSHPDDAPNSRFGSHGNFVFKVPGIEGLGVHSGREGVTDGRGRSGVDHATEGCIRTTDEGTAAIRDAIRSGDSITKITVRNNR